MAGGAERVVHEFARFASSQGHFVTLFAARHPSAAAEQSLDGYGIVRKGNQFTVYGWARTLYGSRFRRERYDVILESITGVPWFTPLYAHEPVVAIWFHVVGRTFLEELPLPLAIAGWFAEASIPAIYRHTHLVALTNVFRQQLVSQGLSENRIHVVPPGLDHSVYFPGLDKSPTPSMVFLGPIKVYKHPEVALGVLAHLLPELPSLHLHVTGWDRGGLSRSLRNQAVRLGIEEHITFHGWLPDRNKAKLLQQAWILLQPSEREGWSLAVMEAAACGTPAVATAIGGMRESVRHGETGLLVPYGSLAAMSNAARALLLDERLRKTLSMGAVRWATQFTWERSAWKMLTVLSETRALSSL
jgi:glycosyltransferase involved in cell wall biosynthesis